MVDNYQPTVYTTSGFTSSPESTMKETYQTIEGKSVPLAGLRADEKAFLAEVFREYESGKNYLSFKHVYSYPESMAFRNAKRLGKPAEESPLYRVCDDLARRLGIRQGYLVKEEIMQYQAMPTTERKELTTGQVAKMAGCSSQAVWKAILTWRLRARKVGRLALIWEEDARAFADSVRRRSGQKSSKARRKEMAHA